MSDARGESEPDYHLFLEPDEVPVTASALRLLISDEAHQPQIRTLARNVLAFLEAPQEEEASGGEVGLVTVPLSAPEMKITHTALHLLLDDLQREQHDERQVLWRVLGKLPDEHAIRAINLA
jgi:hypothetical protein